MENPSQEPVYDEVALWDPLGPGDTEVNSKVKEQLDKRQIEEDRLRLSVQSAAFYDGILEVRRHRLLSWHD